MLTATVLAAVACDSPPPHEVVLPSREAVQPTPPAVLPEQDGALRVDQVGYVTGETKIATLLAPRDATGARVTVVGPRGETVLPPVGTRRGTWNTGFPSVHLIDLTALTRPGTYRVRVEGPVTAESPPFRIGSAGDLFGPLAGNSLVYFQAHRDGADQVAGAWRRAPAHLTDREATVYSDPGYDDDGRMVTAMEPVGGPVDVEGGWYDAGDYLKFSHTTAYALIAMLLVQRDGPAPAGLADETRHGIAWLDKMWDEDTGTLYTQVGIGSGINPGFLGDHDTWRLPQDDDRLTAEPGEARYYQRYRPVFRAAAAGAPLSPNLAGRVSAAFALAAQVEASTDPARARRHLAAAAQIFALADTSDTGDLVTAQPRSFYPEDSWADDLATGAAELVLAGQALRDPRTSEWARQGEHWAEVNTGTGRTDALNVYDLSAIADAELVKAGVSPGGLLRDLRKRLDAGVRAAGTNPFRAAAGNGGYDYASRELGYVVTAALYRGITGDDRYTDFGTTQRGVVLGANGWGTSLVVAAGTTFPRCPHDQIASLTAGPPAPGMTGAVVNGPNKAERIHELIEQRTSDACSTDSFAAYDRDDAQYTDDEQVSANTEPSIDFTATGMLAFALTARDL
ncbi:glycoside hydrolase family 9 protein [Actinoplanes friuliensis]|nr:glycoside hydrolase family 9 protein [Actinoplanes friuliensis]